MSIEENVQVVKDFFAVVGSRDKQRLLALVAEDIEWIIPREDWSLGVATGKTKDANKTFEDHWVFDITGRNGKLTNVRQNVDTQALARAS